MIYLASPYTHKSAYIQHQRFKVVCAVAAKLMSEGKIIFSPIAHGHPIALVGKLPTDWDYWEKFDKEFLNASESMIVLMLDGWEESKGVQAEIKYFTELNRPINHYLPGKGIIECQNPSESCCLE